VAPMPATTSVALPGADPTRGTGGPGCRKRCGLRPTTLDLRRSDVVSPGGFKDHPPDAAAAPRRRRCLVPPAGPADRICYRDAIPRSIV